MFEHHKMRGNDAFLETTTTIYILWISIIVDILDFKMEFLLNEY